MTKEVLAKILEHLTNIEASLDRIEKTLIAMRAEINRIIALERKK
jgi:hypothetical protein